MLNGMNALLFKLLNTMHTNTVVPSPGDCEIPTECVNVVPADYINNTETNLVEPAENANENIPGAPDITSNAQEQDQGQEPTPVSELEAT
jgi:hypothetical protein